MDGAGSWESIRVSRFNVGVAALAVDPRDPATVYLGAVQGVFKSQDRGSTWQEHNTGLPIGSGQEGGVGALAIDPEDPAIVYAGTAAGVYKSIDGGQRWTGINLGLPGSVPAIRSLAVVPGSPRTLYAGTFGAGIWKTDTGGH